MVLAMQVVVFWQFRAGMHAGQSGDSAQAGAIPEPQVLTSPAVPVDSQSPVESPLPPPLTPEAMMGAMMADAVEEVARLQSALHLNRGWEQLPASPSLDMRSTEGGYLVTFNIPDVHSEDLGVLLEGRMLTVRALCGAPGVEGGLRRYERRVLLPGPVGAAEDAQAQLTNGILRVHVPRGLDTGARSVVMRLF